MVEGVERAAEREHHVIRDVDDVGDRPHSGTEQPCLEPARRIGDRDVAKQPPDVTRTAPQVVDADVDLLVRRHRRRGLSPGHGRERHVQQRRDLAGDAVDGREIGPVVARLDLQHGVDERQHVGERSPRLGTVVEQHDPAVVGAELDLVLGEDHPVGDLPANLPAVERQAVGEHGARQRDGDRRTRAEVPRAAHDSARLAFADVDARDLEPVGVRMLLRLEHLADAEPLQIPVLVRDATANDTVDLATGEDEPARELLDGQVEVDVLAQPRNRNLQNCSSTRTSFSQNRRRSARP